MKLDQAMEHLAAKGQKRTPQRATILRILMDYPQPMTAQEIVDKARSTYPHISLDTVYRNLAMLRDCGLVNQINLQNRENMRFEFQSEGKHHHHYVCLGCGRSFCIDSCDIPLPQKAPRENPGFQVIGHAYEVYGYCSKCQS